MTSEINHGRHQRPSLIEFLTGDHGNNKFQTHASAPPAAEPQGLQSPPSQQQRGDMMIIIHTYYFKILN